MARNTRLTWTWVLVAGLLLPAAVAFGRQQETPSRSVRVPVRQYSVLRAADVYRAARADRQVDVRFRDGFARQVPVPEAARSPRVGGRTHVVLLAFRTAEDLLCLVPSTSSEALRTLVGVPAERPISMAALERGIVLSEDQQITVEGTLAGDRYVLVDRVLLSPPTEPAGRRELHLLLPADREPRVMDSPGSRSFEFPCSHVEDAIETLTVTVVEKGREQMAADIAGLTAGLEGLRAERKSYGQYSAGAVYRQAGSGDRVNVDFTDRVARVFPGPLPRELASASAVRRRAPVELNTAYAFETENRLVCLVPDTWPTLSAQARELVPGEMVRVRGTTVGPAGPHNRVLVDSLFFPERLDEQGWWVTLQLGEDRAPLVLWDDGTHRLNQLRCTHAPGRREPMRVRVGRFRSVQPLQAPRPPAGR